MRGRSAGLRPGSAARGQGPPAGQAAAVSAAQGLGGGTHGAARLSAGCTTGGEACPGPGQGRGAGGRPARPGASHSHGGDRPGRGSGVADPERAATYSRRRARKDWPPAAPASACWSCGGAPGRASGARMPGCDGDDPRAARTWPLQPGARRGETPPNRPGTTARPREARGLRQWRQEPQPTAGVAYVSL
jgi:hypothetical protein